MHLFIFGMGYSAGVLAQRLRTRGWLVEGTGRGGTIAFADTGAVHAALGRASHVLSSVPPGRDGADAVLAHYGAALRAGWIGYLSSTGVYGDCDGAWVDESATVGLGRRTTRSQADLAWQALGARVFRLPGIYGPGRSAFDRLRDGTARQPRGCAGLRDALRGLPAVFDDPDGVVEGADLLRDLGEPLFELDPLEYEFRTFSLQYPLCWRAHRSIGFARKRGVQGRFVESANRRATETCSVF